MSKSWCYYSTHAATVVVVVVVVVVALKRAWSLEIASLKFEESYDTFPAGDNCR